MGNSGRKMVRAAVLALAAGGAIAASPAHAASFQTLYSFSGGADGGGPLGRLVMDKAGLLYGTTLSGGSVTGVAGAAAGTVFQFNPATGVLTTLYSFGLAGATGSNPAAGVTLSASGALYGTTESGGTSSFCAYGCGVVFKLVPATQTLTVLHDFTGQADGRTPNGRVTPGPNGLLYGTTAYGGNLAAFSVDATTSAYAVRHAFSYHVDGNAPVADLLLKSGYLVGTTQAGGPSVAALSGTVFALSLASGALTTLHAFDAAPGGLFPAPGVTLDANGLLYGTTNQGGSAGAGTVFSLNPYTKAFALVHDFAISDGSQPAGGLIADAAGALYGVTAGGGRGFGTIFRVVP